MDAKSKQKKEGKDAYADHHIHNHVVNDASSSLLFPFVDISIASILERRQYQSSLSSLLSKDDGFKQENDDDDKTKNKDTLYGHHNTIFHVHPTTWQISMTEEQQKKSSVSLSPSLAPNEEDSSASQNIIKNKKSSSEYGKNNRCSNHKDNFDNDSKTKKESKRVQNNFATCTSTVSMLELQQLAQACDKVVFSAWTMSKVKLPTKQEVAVRENNSSISISSHDDYDDDDEEENVFATSAISSFLRDVIRLASSSFSTTSVSSPPLLYPHGSESSISPQGRNHHHRNKHKQGNNHEVSHELSSSSCSPLSSSPEIFLATLLSLNGLESAIRISAGFENEISTGRAPLLKNMISKIQIVNSTTTIMAVTEKEDYLIMIRSLLEALLLPTGLNLRNLVWHGFIGTSLPRCWLSLIIVLTIQLRKQNDTLEKEETNNDTVATTTATSRSNTIKEHNPSVVRLSDYSLMHPILQRGQELCRNSTALEEFSSSKVLSQSWLQQGQFHAEIWELVVKLIQMGQQRHTIISNKERRENKSCVLSSYPACIACLLSILIEHALRQIWCQVNDGVQYLSKAHPEEYYVTLDGHGQKQKHDLLLHPYYYYYCEEDEDAQNVTTGVDSQRKQQPQMGRANHLIRHIGGGTMAILTDLFCTPSGPNIRAQLCHGMFDRVLENELSRMNGSCYPSKPGIGTDFSADCVSHLPKETFISDNTNNPKYYINASYTRETQTKEDDEWWDTIGALLVSLEGVCSSTSLIKRDFALASTPQPVPCLSRYRPMFSYTAVVMENLQESLTKLERLSDQYQEIQSLHALPVSTTKKHAQLVELFGESVTIDRLQTLKDKILQTAQLPWIQSSVKHSNTNISDWVNAGPSLPSPMGTCPQNHADPLWSTKEVFREYHCNVAFSSCIAARTLLADVANAAACYTGAMQEASRAYAFMNMEKNSTNSTGRSAKALKRVQKLCETADVALTMYKFFTYVALLFIQYKLSDMDSQDDRDGGVLPSTTDSSSLHPQILLKAVERSRMCVSTMDRFLIANSDRAIRAATEFAKGKATKQILQFTIKE